MDTLDYLWIHWVACRYTELDVDACMEYRVTVRYTGLHVDAQGYRWILRVWYRWIHSYSWIYRVI